MSDEMQALQNYNQLKAKVDSKFAEILSRHPSAFHCQKGCHSCCQPGLTVSPIEAKAISIFLSENPGMKSQARAQKAANPHLGQRCSFLSAEGACLIYAARPLICRSHGAPISFVPPTDEMFEETDDDIEPVRDVCPLNFTGQPLDELISQDVLNIETVNSILAVVNLQWKKDPELALQRVPLEPENFED